MSQIRSITLQKRSLKGRQKITPILFSYKDLVLKTLFLLYTSSYISVLIAGQFRAQIGVNLTEMNLVLLQQDRCTLL